MPTNPCGLLFDLLETAIHAKENFNGTLTHLFPTERVEPTVLGEGGGSCEFPGQGNADTSLTSSNNASNQSAASASGPGSESLTSTETTTSALVGSGSSLAGRVARCPVYAIAAQIRASLAYANAYGEWLNPEKESLLYTADAPFPYQTVSFSFTVLSWHK